MLVILFPILIADPFPYLRPASAIIMNIDIAQNDAIDLSIGSVPVGGLPRPVTIDVEAILINLFAFEAGDDRDLSGARLVVR